MYLLSGVFDGMKGYPRKVYILLGVLCVLMPAVLIITLSSFGRGSLWIFPAFLAIESAAFIFIIEYLSDLRSALRVAGIIFGLSFIAALVGSKTGLPFGNFVYTGQLVPLVFGVPVPIMFLWFNIVAGSLIISKFLLRRQGIAATAVVSAVFVLSQDILLEPFAVFINFYWLWEGARLPMQNYLSWLVLGFLFSLVMEFVIKWKENIFESRNLSPVPAVFVILHIGLFAIADIVGGFKLQAAMGLSFFVFESFTIYRMREPEEL